MGRLRVSWVAIGLTILGVAGCGVPGVPSNHDGEIAIDAGGGECWTAQIGNASQEGCGSKGFKASGDIIIAIVQKNSEGRWNLTVTLTENGETKDSGSTDAEFGIVTVQDKGQSSVSPS